MSTTKTRKPVQRFANLSKVSDGYYFLILKIGTEQFGYQVECIPADQGQAFRLTRDGVSYCINVNGPQGHSCECKGFCRWHHCKHVESMAALVAAGKFSQNSQKKA